MNLLTASMSNLLVSKYSRKLIVCEIKNKLKGILLLSFNKKIARIEMIMVNSTNYRKGIASSLISYTNNFYMKKINKLIAGTQEYNYAARKFYQKNNFKLINHKYYHHIYST